MAIKLEEIFPEEKEVIILYLDLIKKSRMSIETFETFLYKINSIIYLDFFVVFLTNHQKRLSILHLVHI